MYQVKITNILNDMYYKFNATLPAIDNNTNPRIMLARNATAKLSSINSNRNLYLPGKEFKILVKIDRNFPNVEPNMNVIAMEIHEVPKKCSRSNQG
ncbi:hypothetical protein H5410_049225 [Solanum commersonii]|uniref:Uncharacterized protein n=1 Tax=Solanum commersonii TaxID=4109 RepID=A0A9J5XMU2_SOLCO|nr:hypothetical protein H5410_049225 [Solanum commersonii]